MSIFGKVFNHTGARKEFDYSCVMVNTCLDHIIMVKHGLLTRKGGLSASLHALEGIRKMSYYERFSIARGRENTLKLMCCMISR